MSAAPACSLSVAAGVFGLCVALALAVPADAARAGALLAAGLLAARIGAWNATRRPAPTRARDETAVLPFAVHMAPARVVWSPADGLPDPAHAQPVAALAAAHGAALVVVHMPPAAEEAARILLQVAWQRLRTGRMCPPVVPHTAWHPPTGVPRARVATPVWR